MRPAHPFIKELRLRNGAPNETTFEPYLERDWLRIALGDLNDDGVKDIVLPAEDPDKVGAYQMRAMRAAFAEGRHYIADPKTNPAPIDELLGAEVTSRLQQAVKTGEHEA